VDRATDCGVRHERRTGPSGKDPQHLNNVHKAAPHLAPKGGRGQ